VVFGAQVSVMPADASAGAAVMLKLVTLL